jgi:hypothetical protein
MADTQQPNVISFHLDNLGYGEQMESNRQGFLWTSYRPGNSRASVMWAEQTC